MTIEISPELLNAVANFQRDVVRISKEFQPYINQLDRVAEAFRPLKELAATIIQSSSFKHGASLLSCGVMPHPVLSELFEADFTADNLEDKWDQISALLSERVPESLDKEYRKDRYKQILACQTIGAYIPVCRAVYAEIESLFRDEMLLSDPSWFKEWSSKTNGSQRRGFQSTELTKLVNNRHPDFKLIDDDTPISDIGWYTLHFLLALEQMFKNFDPVSANDPDTKSWRHIHAHGWAKQASFIDGLNGILAFDLAMDFVGKTTAERNEDLKNED